jgi:hypothetical protein
MTKDERQNLIDLTWQYAVITGITNPEGIMPEPQLAEYRSRWPHLMKRSDDNLPIFDDVEAARWMAEVSAMPYEDCLGVLKDQWHCEPSPDAD